MEVAVAAPAVVTEVSAAVVVGWPMVWMKVIDGLRGEYPELEAIFDAVYRQRPA